MSDTPQDHRRHQGVENGWVCVGAFAGSHGVRGDVKLRSFTSDPKGIKKFDEVHQGADGPLVRFKVGKAIKGGFAAHIDGIDNPEEAQLLNGTQLYVKRDAISDKLDDDEFFLADLIGLEVVDLDANPVGHVRSVENYGSDDLIEIVMPKPVKGLGRFALVPFTHAWVPVVDIKSERIVVSFDEWVATQVEVPTDDSKDNGDD